jgi:hypothetical protein
MSQFNRRTLVRGAAWSIPVVAIAAHAPAFATSTEAPTPGGIAMSCRTTGNGGGDCQGYRVVLSFSLSGSDTWNVRIAPSDITTTSHGTASQIKIPTSFPQEIGPGATTMRLWFCTNKSADFVDDLSVSYEVQRTDLPSSPWQRLTFPAQSFTSVTNVCPSWA